MANGTPNLGPKESGSIHTNTPPPPEAERNMRTIFRRCLQCSPGAPTCPDCARGEICSLVPQSCDECAHMVCIANPNPSPPPQRTNVGAIAGGVIGGVVFMSIAIFIFWRFWIKKRRAQQEAEAEEWEEDDIATQKGTRFNAMRSDAVSTRTRASIASSILTRASNIIHIAYIPGVTNRNGGSGHNSLLAAPVPPIPAAYANRTPQATTPKSPLSNEGDALFFRPGSIRDSTYTDSSSIRSGKRDTQYTTHSITPSLARSSMMSDVYRDDATTEPMPAIQVHRVLPRMVSVKSKDSAGSPSMESPPSSSSATGPKVMMPGQSSPNSSPGSGGQFAKATQVTVRGKGKGRFPIARSPSDSSAHTKPTKPSPLVETANESDDEEEHARARKSLIRDSTALAANPAPLIQPLESPFFDATEVQTSASSSSQAQRPNPYAAMSASVGSGSRRIQRNHSEARGPGGLSAVIEEAAKRASADPDHQGIGGKRDHSPFSDVHATK